MVSLTRKKSQMLLTGAKSNGREIKPEDTLKRNQSMKSLKCLYFDGHKDKTNYVDDGRRYIIVEEHVVLIAEPGGYYLGHVTPEAGTSKGIVKAILFYFLKEETIDSSCLRVIGCDGL
jgi:hypothetical protein